MFIYVSNTACIVYITAELLAWDFATAAPTVKRASAAGIDWHVSGGGDSFHCELAGSLQAWGKAMGEAIACSVGQLIYLVVEV